MRDLSWKVMHKFVLSSELQTGAASVASESASAPTRFTQACLAAAQSRRLGRLKAALKSSSSRSNLALPEMSLDCCSRSLLVTITLRFLFCLASRWASVSGRQFRTVALHLALAASARCRPAVLLVCSGLTWSNLTFATGGGFRKVFQG